MQRAKGRQSLSILCSLLACIMVLSACSSKKPQNTNKQPSISAEVKLHRAIFSQDIERIEYALKLGADVNTPINKSEHKQPAIEMPVKHSSPLNAIISDYKYQDALFVAPLEHGQNYNERAIEIINLLLKAGADIHASQFYPNKQNLTFELGGPRLALAMPFLIDYGFTPTIEDLIHAYQHYSSFKNAADKNKTIIRHLKQISVQLPKNLRLFLERYEQEIQDKIEAERNAEAQAKYKAQKFKDMQKYALKHQTTEPFYQGQKACIFEDYIFTLGFVMNEKEGKDKIGFKPAYSYRYDENGFKRGSRQREKSSIKTVNANALSRCPSGA